VPVYGEHRVICEFSTHKVETPRFLFTSCSVPQGGGIWLWGDFTIPDLREDGKKADLDRIRSKRPPIMHSHVFTRNSAVRG
jgi:hypothetical protein